MLRNGQIELRPLKKSIEISQSFQDNFQDNFQISFSASLSDWHLNSVRKSMKMWRVK